MARKPSKITIKASARRLLGTKVGNLLVCDVNLSKGKKDSYGRYVNCICDCGGFACKDATNLEAGQNTSCGCIKALDKNKYKGEIFNGVGGEKLVITEYLSAVDVTIKFLSTGYTKKHVQMSQIRRGAVLNRLLPTVYGIGINDCIKNVNSSLIYKKWQAMLERCYSEKFKSRHQEYKGCFVNREWHTLSNFKDWVESQDIKDLKGMDLDKDLLVFGNKEYSSNNCKLLPKTLNIFLTDNLINRGDLPIGVSRENKKGVWTGRYRAQCQDPFNKITKSSYIGVYDTILEAFEMWRVTKQKYAKDLIRSHNITDLEVVEALIGRYELGSSLVNFELQRYKNFI